MNTQVPIQLAQLAQPAQAVQPAQPAQPAQLAQPAQQAQVAQQALGGFRTRQQRLRFGLHLLANPQAQGGRRFRARVSESNVQAINSLANAGRR